MLGRKNKLLVDMNSYLSINWPLLVQTSLFHAVCCVDRFAIPLLIGNQLCIYFSRIHSLEEPIEGHEQ
jgi:hypothetical protein